MLNEKETMVIKELQTQEKSCISKYDKYTNEAKDQVLKELFSQLKKKEEQHYQTLGQILNGSIPDCDCNDESGKEYSPTATYNSLGNEADKQSDCFLATDSIASEKYVSGEYNTDVFSFANTAIRKVLADIQIEEQNHGEMLYKYKTVNGMA